MKPYVLLSDLHFHAWSQFASVNYEGVNSRLMGLIGEVRRAAAELVKAGGDKMYLAGDIFHTRGSVEPVVLNSVMDLFSSLRESGIQVYAIPGNHDLAGKDAARLHNAAAALSEVGVEMAHEKTISYADPSNPLESNFVAMIPWREDLEVLRQEIIEFSAELRHRVDLIIHAPVNKVIAGIPDHGLDPEWLAGLGFRNVFAGHYHNHKQVAKGVWSIGALAHHTWSDVGTKSGFLLVGDEVRWMKSHLPEFIDLQKDMPEDEVQMLVDQNYVRAKVGEVSLKKIEALRDMLTEAGAKGVIIQSVKELTHTRADKVVSAGESLSVSVTSFIKAICLDSEMTEKVNRECFEVMAEAGIL